jgi:hypothetical protein
MDTPYNRDRGIRMRSRTSPVFDRSMASPSVDRSRTSPAFERSRISPSTEKSGTSPSVDRSRTMSEESSSPGTRASPVEVLIFKSLVFLLVRCFFVCYSILFFYINTK